MNTITVTNSRGVPFTVRAVRKGDHYGLDFMLVHDEELALIEFYDQRYEHTEYGQFVTRYHADTLAQSTACTLSLMFGTDDWTIDGVAMGQVREFARRIA